MPPIAADRVDMVDTVGAEVLVLLVASAVGIVVGHEVLVARETKVERTTQKNEKKAKKKMMNRELQGKSQVVADSVVATVEEAIVPVISTVLAGILTEKRVPATRSKAKKSIKKGMSIALVDREDLLAMAFEAEAVAVVDPVDIMAVEVDLLKEGYRKTGFKKMEAIQSKDALVTARDLSEGVEVVVVAEPSLALEKKWMERWRGQRRTLIMKAVRNNIVRRILQHEIEDQRSLEPSSFMEQSLLFVLGNNTFFSFLMGPVLSILSSSIFPP